MAATYPEITKQNTSRSTTDDGKIVGFGGESINEIISKHWVR